MSHLDFNYLVISNQQFDSTSLRTTFSFFGDLGIKKFLFTVDCHCDRYSVSQMTDRIRQAHIALEAVRPRGISVAVCANVQMYEGISEDPLLHRLYANRSNYLFLKLPIFSSEDWINMDLNRILFQRHCIPIFSRFEENMKTNPKSQMELLLYSSSFIGCFDLNYITSLVAFQSISDMIRHEVAILPSISHNIHDYAGVYKSFIDFKNRSGTEQYVDLCRNIQRSGNVLKALF